MTPTGVNRQSVTVIATYFSVSIALAFFYLYYVAIVEVPHQNGFIYIADDILDDEKSKCL